MQRILLAILVYLMTSQVVAINCYSVEPDEFLQIFQEIIVIE